MRSSVVKRNQRHFEKCWSLVLLLVGFLAGIRVMLSDFQEKSL